METGSYLIYTIVTVILCKILHWYWCNRNYFKDIPEAQQISPIWQLRILKYMDNVVNYVTLLFETYKCLNVCVWWGSVPVLFTKDLDLIQEICTSPALQQKSLFYEPSKTLIMGGLGFISGERWHRNRRLLNPCFHNSLLLKFNGKFNKSKDEGISELHALVDGKGHNLGDLMTYITVKTLLETSLQTELPKEKVDEITERISFTTKYALWNMIWTVFKIPLVLRLNWKFEKHAKELKNILHKIFLRKLQLHPRDSATKETTSDGSIRKSPKILIEQLIKIYESKQFTMDDVISELIMVIGASFDTSGITIYAVLAMLAMHPDVQERVYEEIVTVFPDKNFQIDHEHIKQLQYLDMVIKETMRLIPAVALMARGVQSDTALSKGVVLRKGLQVVVPIFHLHRRKDIWGEDANEFNPDHFLPANVAKLHPYAYIPYSKGSRICIGWRYADIMMRVVLSGFIRNFRFETDSKYDELEFENGLVISFKVPPLLKVHPRQ